MAGRKQGILDWLPPGKGDATFPSSDYSFWAGAMGFADTTPNSTVPERSKKTNWNIPGEFLYSLSKDSVLSKNTQIIRKNVLGALKWADVLIQVFSGTLLFGAIQNAGERLRDAYKTDTRPLGWIAGTFGGAVALIGRAGLFVTQILAGAIRLPLAIVSGALGLVWGMGVSVANKQPVGKCMYAGMIDFIWPFAPRTANRQIGAAALDELSKQSSSDVAAKTRDKNITLAIGVLSIIAAIVLVTLLTTGTFGVGIAALPAVNAIAGGIATTLNTVFGWAGLHIAFHASSTPILSGIAHWAGLGVFSKSALVATMLVGAVSTFFSNVMHMFKDNTIGSSSSVMSGVRRDRLVIGTSTEVTFQQPVYSERSEHTPDSATNPGESHSSRSSIKAGSSNLSG